ncbi:MAG: glycine cleavage system protein H [Candidatus Thorarchaeota archaeon SMTZ-45]|nr:MAG: glycine cleavage system protein H [Candidatus Thorarchaeota archaeon SMTZ1-45]KXH76848.1 MAG: glycine cleavage system protein H [Candidatus Thorarchaeota archaeon SMTZ-45]
MSDTDVKDDRKYSKDHEWIKVEGDLVVVGITDFAQNSLHEITFVEISEVGTVLEANSECGLVESMKASSDIFSPVGGEIVEVNKELEDAPEIVNEDPYGKGWMFKLKPSNLDADLAGLMDAAAYKEFIESL